MCILGLLMPAAALANNADPFGFFEEDYSSWGLVDAPYPYDESVARPSRPRAARMAGETPAPPTLAKDDLRYGCFPVGNGLVFAHLGVDDDFNTLRGITGPGYQTRTDDGAVTYWREGNWPDQPLELAFTLGDGDVEVLQYTWTTQSIQQLRGAAMVRTIQRSPGVDLYTLTYAVPGKPIVIRETALFPKGGGKAGDWLLRLSPAGELVEDHKDIIAQGSKRLIGLSLYPNPKGYPRLIHADGAVYQRAFQDDQDARPCVRFAIAYGVYSDNQKPPTLAGVDVDELRRSVYAYWQTWSSRNQKFDTGDPRLDDLMAQLPVIIETQRDAYSGGVAPMVSYHGYWVRDSMGPILAYLANGRFDHVKRMLRYHRAACLQYKQSHMLVPLDLDLSDLPGWLPGDPGTAGDLSQIGLSPADWEGTPVEHAEVPSLIALQHYLLWRGMHKAGLGEAADEFIREAWAFISHNLFAMRFDPDYGVKFHGDETYTHGSLYSTYDRPESGAIGYPNGYIPTDFFSFDNTILHRAAAAAAYEMSEAARDEAAQGKAKELTEQLDGIVNNYYVGSHYAPAISPLTGQKWVRQFANIGLRPFWLDLPYGKLRSNQGISLRESLWRGGRALTTPWTG
ncbi:hypothetical protein IIA79_01790, partial [bacterium]|nr:hypothetical protein [bacterium]